jgi:asparagine synthase (glutamine-hydrolysing)
MCGIAGVVRFDGRSLQVSDIKSMTDIIAHRGPDGEGQWLSDAGHIGLGHRRLSIIDLSENGHQPMSYANERYHIVFNGEIYNYLEIRQFLLKKGYAFHSLSDTEVLLALYDFKREDLFHDLDGMFAFVIYDKKEETIFCARDRFGEKPFYYRYQPGEYFAFGSEMKAIWNYTGLKEINNEMVYYYLQYGFVTNPQIPEDTFYKNIYQLPAATYCLIKNGNVSFNKYWNIDLTNKSSINFEEAKEQFRHLFIESVNRRLRSDVPVGSSLSGGLDSSLVVCIVSEILGGKNMQTNTFSARFKNYEKDEGKYMQYVVDKTKANPHYIFSESDVLDQEIDKIFYHQEEPFGSSSILVQYQVFELAKKNNVTVLLDGQGADEILAGYMPYYETYFNELCLHNPKEVEKQITAYLTLHNDNKINKPSLKLHNRVEYFKRWLRAKTPFLISMARSFRNGTTEPAIGNLSADFFKAYSKSIAPVFEYDANSLNSHLMAHSTQYGLGTLLRYADRNSMAHSREVRLPFLSHELVEFLFSLPSSFKIQDGWTKYLMRKAFEDTLPKEIAWRKDKIGYEPPQKEWMNQPEIIERVIQAKKKLVANNILDKKILDQEPIFSAANESGDKSWEYVMVSKLIS